MNDPFHTGCFPNPYDHRPFNPAPVSDYPGMRNPSVGPWFPKHFKPDGRPL